MEWLVGISQKPRHHDESLVVGVQTCAEQLPGKLPGRESSHLTFTHLEKKMKDYIYTVNVYTEFKLPRKQRVKGQCFAGVCVCTKRTEDTWKSMER